MITMAWQAEGRGLTACARVRVQGRAEPEMAEIKLAKLPFLLAWVGRERDHKVAHIGVSCGQRHRRGPELLVEAKSIMPKLLLAAFDFWLWISWARSFRRRHGSAHDGTHLTPFVQAGPPPTRLVGLDVTERSHGNCCGVGQCRHHDAAAVQQDGPGIHVYERVDVDGDHQPRGADHGFRQLADSSGAEDVNVIDQSKVRMARICQHAAHYRDVCFESMLDEARSTRTLRF